MDIIPQKLNEAIRLANLGYRVFPCVPGKKNPLTEHGLRDATADQQIIERWWQSYPAANIGVSAAGLLVIDVDPDGFDWLTGEREESLLSAAGAISYTPRGGKHLIFRKPAEKTWRCSTGRLYRGVDVRTDGGYIVVPPSVTQNGQYRWADGKQLALPPDQLPEPPSWLCELLDQKAKPRRQKNANSANGKLPDVIPMGMRNSTLTKIAGSWRCRGYSKDELFEILCTINERRCQPPLDRNEVMRIASSIARYPPAVNIQPQEGAHSPTVTITTDQEAVVNQAIELLAKRGDVYQRSGMLVHVTREAKPGAKLARPACAPRIAVLEQPTIRERLAASAHWVYEKHEDTPVHPPEWIARAVAARGQWASIPRLEAVVTTPVLRADGSVLQTPGYDPETGLLYDPEISFPNIDDEPSYEDARRARDALLEVVADFPFATDAHHADDAHCAADFPFAHNAHCAAWLAALLTPLARYAFEGPAPLVLVDSNVRGAGKGLLCDTIGIIITGRPIPRLAPPGDPEETRKLITSVAIAGEQLVLLDNVAGSLGNSVLDAALTATAWRDRILGESRLLNNLPLHTVWMATSNNAVLGADTSRRTLWIRLESPLERPEERKHFRYPKLLAWVESNRAHLLAAAITILRAYVVAGRPPMELPAWGSFEAWSDWVRQPIVWLGLPDPAATRCELMETVDIETVLVRRLMDGWQEADPTGAGLTAAEAVELISNYPSKYATLRRALLELIPTRDGQRVSARSLGMKLHHLRGRIFAGRYFAQRTVNKENRWVVKTVECRQVG